MDQLVNKLTECLQEHFGARLVSTTITQESSMQQVNAFGMQSPVAIYGGPTTASLKLTVEEQQGAHFMNAIRTGLFQELMSSSGRMVSMQTNMSGTEPVVTTVIELILLDPEALIADIEKFSWDMYNKEFRELMEKTLTD